MSSIYPSAIDGYAQLPLVVDTVTQINADTVNRLREAIINIETELGVTPKGTYETVAARLNTFESADFSSILASIEELSTKINQIIAITSVSVDTTLDETHGTVLVDASSGPVTITLPSVASGYIKIYNIKKIDSTTNIVTISPQAGETLDGESTFDINFQYDSYSITNHSTGWFNI